MKRFRRLVGWMLMLSLCACYMLVAPEAAMAYPENPLPYRIHVSRAAQIVTVFDTQTGEVVRQMICSTGAAGSPTIKGRFKLPKPQSDERKNWYAFSATCWAHYATRIKGSYLFHSILYGRAATSSLNRLSWSMIGQRASHGCIRMTPLDAQWIAYNCAAGTEVLINDSAPNGPITKSSQIKRTLPSARSDGTLPGWEATLKPTPKPSAQDAPTLDVGIEGPLTKSMQDSLRSLGHFTGSLNGKFGTDTQEALKRFQEAYLKQNPGETVDATVSGLGTPAWQSRVKAGKSDMALTGTSRTLKLNVSGTSVKVLRTQLYALRYTTATPASGYDAKTKEAVKLFQRANGLKIDGVATEAVQQAILAQDQKPLAYAHVNLANGLSVRASQSSKGKLVVKLKNGTQLRVVKTYGDWTYVAVGAKSGYVQSQYLAYEDSV